MHTYFFFGTYTSTALREARSDRTDKAVGVIEDLNGNIVDIYALLGGADLVIIANLPGNTEALKASVALNRVTGIQFDTRPAVSVKRFDEVLSPGGPIDIDPDDFPDFPEGLRGTDLN